MKHLLIRDQHYYLFADWQRVEDPGGVIDEAGLQHLVRLVQDGEPHIVHTQETLTNQLLDPAWGAQSDLTNQRLVFRSRDQCGPIRGQYYLMVDQGSSQGMEQEMKRTGRAWVRMFRLSLCQ